MASKIVRLMVNKTRVASSVPTNLFEQLQCLDAIALNENLSRDEDRLEMFLSKPLSAQV